MFIVQILKRKKMERKALLCDGNCEANEAL